MSNFHSLDFIVVTVYLAVILLTGRAAAVKHSSQEGFFLAGRKLGKVYQFFLNFGNATEASGAVSTASIVYQQGISGFWIGFQNIFLNPYYWFMNSWFRRVRLTTAADLFEDRLGSRRLAVFYAVFQILAVVVSIGFGNLVVYKICATLVVKPQVTWTVAEQQSVQGYQDLRRLEKTQTMGTLPPVDTARLEFLRESAARGELRSYITALEPWSFYFFFNAAVGLYIGMGGMAAAARNEAFQGLLIVVFSAILIPTGLAAIGGWGQLASGVPAGMFRLFGGDGVSEISGWGVMAMFVTAMLQVNGIVGNMGISGSARNEFAARFGAVAGTFAKRVMMILWAFAGLIAVVVFSGINTLSDPDVVWGAMSRQLLGPGLLGLMLAGVLAAQMSHVAAYTMCVSALFARNVYPYFRPDLSEGDVVRVGRWSIAAVLAVAIVAATQMQNVYTVLQLHMTLNISFGAAVLLMFFWRRITARAVFVTVIVCAIVNTIIPLVAERVPAWRSHPALAVRGIDPVGRPSAVYFETVVRSDPKDLTSALEGRGRFHAELFMLKLVGLEVPAMSPSGRFAARFFVDAFLPLLLLASISLVTRPPTVERIDQFYGKMRTPVGGTHELEATAVEETRRDPHRFDQLKIWPNSSWEFTRWNRMDALGFIACCLVTLMIVAALWVLLKWAGP